MVFYRTINFLANCLFIFLALDPAKPWFDITDLSNTLYRRTFWNFCIFFKGGLSPLEPLGHVDFYPNGGKNQPGAISSHYRAVEYYIESIYASPARIFLSKNCNSWKQFQYNDCHEHTDQLPMGEALNKDM